LEFAQSVILEGSVFSLLINMVKQGKFSVELVCAETKLAFPEHTAPNGETYVEAEPDAEYFIRIATDSEEIVRVDPSVDGESLGYRSFFSKADSPMVRGLWSYVDGKSYHHALKFAKTPVREAVNGSTLPTSWTGKVKVTFSEAILDGYKERQDHTNTWNGGDVSYVMGISDPDKKKGVKSDKGIQFDVREETRRREKYKSGRLLSTITLRYCSILGLIEAGILPKPPLWDYHRMIRPRDPEEDSVVEPLEPVLMDVTCRVHNVEQVVKVEVFDLTK
jgi:hypothetical protein